MLSYQLEKRTSFNEAYPFKSTKADLAVAVSTNPKAISRLISAAVVDRSFQKLLLTRPETALASDYNGEAFDLTDEDRAMILTIQAASINDFAAQLVRLRENNCTGEWVVRKHSSDVGVYPMPISPKPSWNMASLTTA